MDADRFLEVVRQERPRLVFLAWPNNPTGNLFDAAAVEAILTACGGRDGQALVVVDEAYVHYSGRSFLGRLDEFPNLVVLRTLSKIGLAGIRLGMLIAAPEVVREVNKVRMPYNVNALSQAAARVVLAHGDVVRRHAAAIVAGAGPGPGGAGSDAGGDGLPQRCQLHPAADAPAGGRGLRRSAGRGHPGPQLLPGAAPRRVPARHRSAPPRRTTPFSHALAAALGPRRTA